MEDWYCISGGLQRILTVDYREDCNLICSIRRTGTGSVVDCRVYGGLEHGV